MEQTETTRQQLQDLFSSQYLAVLSTYGDGQPYTSLVAFRVSDDLKALYFVTARSTRKFDNLAAHPRVALLIDDRSNRVEDFQEAVAATVTGIAEAVPAGEGEPLKARFLEKHPHLASFVADPDTALIRVRIDCHYLVSRFQKVTPLPISG
jgi:nitroimidazol reductase NimA-like FMN-containing flavoprotein (pyridoxamine 5'-phosphate oxidase superfamily)